MLIFFLPLNLAVLTVYVVAVSAVPTISTTPGLTNTANLDDPGPSTILAPHDSINVTHDFPAEDSFIQSGAGDHSIEPPNFTHVDADDTLEDLHTTVEGIVKIKLSGPLAAPRDVHDKRAFGRGPRFENCGSGKEAIEAAIEGARRSIRRVYRGIDRLRAEDVARDTPLAHLYGRWFGPYTEERREAVKQNLEAMKRKVSFSSYTFSCQRGRQTAYPAEIYSGNGLIMVYDLFLYGGSVLQENTIIRMVGTLGPTIREDRAVGRIAARDLALTEAREAVFNLANYEAFIQMASDPYNPGDIRHFGA